MNFVVIGARGKDRVVEKGVFGEIAEGRVENAVYISPRVSTGILSRIAYRVAGSRRVPHRFKPIIKAPWEVKYRDVAPLLRSDMPNCVIFCPTTHPFERIQPALLHGLRKHAPDCPLVFYLVDGMKRTMESNGCGREKLTGFLSQFDLVLTYDRQDAEEYHYEYMELPVWTAKETAPVNAEYDVYFCGRGKGREGLLNGIYEHLEAGGARPMMVISGEGRTDGREGHFHVQSWRPYSEVVEQMKKARCVLEILAGSNTSATLRYKEAVVYNKKLLTNNPHASAMPYFDARWMRIFEKPEDIDVQWLLDDEPVDYGYRGDFSAKRFLEKVEALIDQK